MKIKVVNQRLYLEPPETAEGTREYLRAEFDFSEEWDGMTKTAFFRGAGNTYSQLLKDDACTVPTEALAAPGWVGVSVSGTLGETVITTDIKSFSVPATLSGGTPSDPEPTVWQQILDKFEKLPEAIDTALAQAKESGVFDGKDGANGKDGTPGEQGPKGDPGETTYIENPYDDTELKSEIATKITAPENPEVGKVFKIKSVNDDGTFIGEWADDGGSNLDVQINGESIVRDGVAEIPIAAKTKKAGLVTIDEYATSGGIARANVSTGLIRIQPASKSNIDARNNSHCPIVPDSSLDYAVKAAMCDGKGAAWTEEEQAAARERMGIDDWEDVITYITSSEEEECITCYIDFEHTYKKIYVLIDESGIEGTTYMSTRFGVIGKNKLHNVALITNTASAFNVKNKYKTFSAEVMNTADISYQYTAASTVQLYSYCENPFIGRAGPPSITTVDASAIGGITWYGKMYAGTRIVVKGVRA